MSERWTLLRLCEEVLANQGFLYKFCKERGLIAASPLCKRCRRPMTWSVRADIGDGFSWRCTFRSCTNHSCHRSIRHGSWFANSPLSMKKILVLTYCWATKMSNQRAMHEASYDTGTSSETIIDWFMYCREVCLHAVQQDGNKQIGGPDKVVEIDEFKLRRWKFSRSRIVDGRWVLGGICRQTKDAFLIEVASRDAATLIPLIKEYVAAGSTVITDCWKSYDCLDEEGFQDLAVNHSLNFVDPTTGGHMKNIKYQWWKIKRGLLRKNSEGFGLHFGEYMWRQRNASRDHFNQILQDILNLYKPPLRF